MDRNAQDVKIQGETGDQYDGRSDQPERLTDRRKDKVGLCLRNGLHIRLQTKAGQTAGSQGKQGGIQLVSIRHHILFRIKPCGNTRQLIGSDKTGQQFVLEEKQIEEHEQDKQDETAADDDPLFFDAAAHQHDDQRDADDHDRCRYPAAAGSAAEVPLPIVKSS